MSFQWFRSGESLANQTNVTLLLPAFASADAGVYELRVTNRHGVAWGPPRELRLSERESEPPVLSALLQQGGATTRVLLGLTADPAEKYRVEGSSDLSTWIPVEAVLSPNAFVEVARLPGAEISHWYYRVVSRP